MAHFRVNARSPRARAVCDRCGFQYQHHELQWQFQWQGPRLQNIRRLVCDSCLDNPQQQLRTIIIPADPLPILNPRPEANVQNNNPISPIGQNADPRSPFGTNIGTLNYGGGTYAAFDSNINKPAHFSAYIAVSVSSYGNWVGKNWASDPSGVTTPSELTRSTPVYRASGFTIVSPNNTSFLGSTYATPYRFQGSSDGVNWTTLYSSQTDGSIGQSITVDNIPGDMYQFHRVDFVGNGNSPVSVAQLQINVSAVQLSTDVVEYNYVTWVNNYGVTCYWVNDLGQKVQWAN